MTLKKICQLTLIALLLLSTKQSKAQITLSPTDTTFAQIYAKYSTLTPDTVFDSPYNKWKSMQAFWSKRLPPGGSFKYYNAAYKQLYNSLNSTSTAFVTSTSPFGNWQSKGPTNVNSTNPSFNVNNFNLGRTDRIQVDPDDATGNTIYVCSTTGGIFKTTDGGANWSNFFIDIQSINTPFGSTRVSEIRLAKDIPNRHYIS